MIFHSLAFLAFFLIVVTVYWRLPHRAQNLFLLGASYVFYGVFPHTWWPDQSCARRTSWCRWRVRDSFPLSLRAAASC